MVVCQARNCVTSSSQGEPNSGLPRQFKMLRCNLRCNLNTRVNLIFDQKNSPDKIHLHRENRVPKDRSQRTKNIFIRKIVFSINHFYQVMVLIFIKFLNYFFIKSSSLIYFFKLSAFI